MTDQSIDTILQESRDDLSSLRQRRISDAEKAHLFSRAQNSYYTLWSGFILENDEELQTAKDNHLPYTRPMSEKVIRECVELSGRKLADLRPEISRTQAEMDWELTCLGKSELPLEEASLHYIPGWQYIHQISNAMQSQGVTLDKARLLQPNSTEQGSYLSRAAELRQLHHALDFLNSHNEQLSADDLLTDDGKPSTVLQACISAQESPKLFREKNWLGQSADSLRKVYHALPKEQQAQVTNYYSLYNHLRSHEPKERNIGR